MKVCLSPSLAIILVASTLTPVQAATWAEERIAVIAGTNVGMVHDETLLYAEKDARKVRDLLIELGGIPPHQAILSLRGGAKTVLQALHRAQERAAALHAAGKRVTFIFYFSGHGDDLSLHLPRGNLALNELRAAVSRIPAALRISIIDACRTGRMDKGTRRGPAFSLAVAANTPRGTVELRSSSMGEVAQESHKLAGSLFTHYLVSGLRGGADVDRDGRVTLPEIYAHVYRKTLVGSLRGGAPQHPDLAIKTSGAGEIVITNLKKASASIEVPGDADRYLVFKSHTSTVMGEITRGGNKILTLPTGRFIVARQQASAMSVANVDLSWGGAKRLTDRDFRTISHEELVIRGGHIKFCPWQIELQAGVELFPLGAEKEALRTAAVFSYASGSLLLRAGLGFIQGALETVSSKGDQWAIVGGPSVGWRWFMGAATLSALLGVDFRYGWQDLEHQDAQRAKAAGFAWKETRSYGAIGPRAGFHLVLPLGWKIYAALDVSGTALFRREYDGLDTLIACQPTVYSAIGLGTSF